MELNFQKIVLIVATCLLIVALVATSYMMKKNISNTKWPPGDISQTCPDYWEIGSTGTICVNRNGINMGGLTGAGRNSLNLANYSACQKYLWANQNRVSWDGVSNINNPCVSREQLPA